MDLLVFLLKCKANPNFCCADGNTALHFAFKIKDYEAIKLLREAKGDIY